MGESQRLGDRGDIFAYLTASTVILYRISCSLGYAKWRHVGCKVHMEGRQYAATSFYVLEGGGIRGRYRFQPGLITGGALLRSTSALSTRDVLQEGIYFRKW